MERYSLGIYQYQQGNVHIDMVVSFGIESAKLWDFSRKWDQPGSFLQKEFSLEEKCWIGALGFPLFASFDELTQDQQHFFQQQREEFFFLKKEKERKTKGEN